MLYFFFAQSENSKQQYCRYNEFLSRKLAQGKLALSFPKGLPAGISNCIFLI